MLDVLLINPAGYSGSPRRGPYELAGFASALANQGLAVELFDVQREVGTGAIPYPAGHMAAVRDRISSQPARLYLITLRTTAGPWAHEIARQIKSCDPAGYIVAFAPRIEERVIQLMQRHDAFDAIFLSDPRYDFVDFAREWLSGRPSGYARFPGLVERGAITGNERGRLNGETADGEPQTYEVGSPWLSLDGTIAAIQVGRGCPERCTFCCAHLGAGGKPRYADPNEIADAAQRTFDILDGKKRLFVMLETENLTSNRELIRDIYLRREACGYDFHWGGYGRIDHMDEEMIELLVVSGCRFLFFGIETSSQALLKTLGKTYDPSIVLPRIRALQSRRITTHSSLIFGIPGETYRDFVKTAELMAQISWSGGFVDWTPLRIEAGSAMERMTSDMPKRLLTHTELYQDLEADHLDPRACDPLVGYRFYGLDLAEIDVDRLGFVALHYRSALVRSPLTLYALHSGLGFPVDDILSAIGAAPPTGDMARSWIGALLDERPVATRRFIWELYETERQLRDPMAQASTTESFYAIGPLYEMLRQSPRRIPELFQLSWWQGSAVSVEETAPAETAGNPAAGGLIV